MGNSELYNDFFEGNLDISGEHQFIEMLRADDSFRNGLKGFVNVSGTIKSNIKLFGPSMNETSELYQKLGFTIPAGYVNPLPAGGFKSSLLQNPLMRLLLTGITSSAVTLLAVFFIWGSNGNTMNESRSAERINNPVPIVSAEKSYEKTQPAIIHKQISKPAQDKALQKANKTEKANEFANADEFAKADETVKAEDLNAPALNQEPGILTSPIHLPAVDYPYSESFIPAQFSMPERQFEPANLIFTNNGIVLEIRNSMNWNLPAETITPYRLSKLNGMALSLLYQINDIYRIGLDLRQETFFVQYKYEDMYRRINYEQQPNLLSYGLVLNYSPPIDFWNFRPDITLNFSGNNYGLIGRGGLGLEYNFGNRLKGILNAEYSKLFFIHESNWFQAGKVNFNYGIKYCF